MLITPIDDVKRNATRVLAPSQRLHVDEWADKYRILDRMTAAEPGLWRTARTPYLRQPMRDFTDALVEEITIVAATQVGKTEAILNMISYAIDQDPGSAMVVLPREDDAKNWGQKRCRSALENSPRLALHLTGKEDDIQGKLFTLDRMYLKLAGANSPADLVSDPCRYVFFDEVDKYPQFTGRDSSALKLGRKRTTTFWNRKIVEASTPTLEEGAIWQSLMASQFHRYFVPCPFCNLYQAIGFRREDKIGWSKARHATMGWPKGVTAKDIEGGGVGVWIECAGCKKQIEESHKEAIVAAGVWCPEGCDVERGRVVGKREVRMKRGYHIPAMVSPWVSWAQLALGFLSAKDEPDGLMSFVNNDLAEPFQHRSILRVDAHPLMQRREVWTEEIPDGVYLLTCGVDIQQDRIEYEVVGWGMEMESWSVKYGVLWGDTTRAAVWKELDVELSRTWLSVEGVKLGIVRTFIDASAFTAIVYSFVRKRQIRQIFAVKGEDGAGRPIAILSKAQVRSTGLHLWILGVDSAKDAVFGAMRAEVPGANYMHFPMYDEDYFLMLTAERPTIKYRKGFPVRSYEKIRDRNEALDVRVYAYAAFYSLNANMLDIRATFLEAADEERAKKPAASPIAMPLSNAEWSQPNPLMIPAGTRVRPRRGFVKGWR